MVLGGCGGTHAQIDWVNFIKVHGIMYVVPPIGDTTVPVSLQGMMATTVHFQIADHISDPTYQANDGDAAFLPVGTPIYQVIGYRETFRLMALWNGHMTLFEASTLAHAQTGADLLDIRDKVARIGVLWNIDTAPGVHEQGSITDPPSVQSFVAAVLAAPLYTSTPPTLGTRVFLAFHLHDGTETVRVLYPDTHNLAGIQVSDAVVQAVQPFLPPPTATDSP